jgi:hypothetical protein
VADGDRMVLSYPDYTCEDLHREYMWFSARASEINRSDGYRHYRISKLTELRQLVIIAKRREDHDKEGI